MRVSKEEYQEAYLLWRKQHPEEQWFSQSTVVTLPSGKQVNLGERIIMIRVIYQAMQRGEHYGANKDLTKEEISWWTEHGLDLSTFQRVIYTKEEYREAYLLWKKENPEEQLIPQSTVVTLPSGKKIPLENRMSTMKSSYNATRKTLQSKEKNKQNLHIINSILTEFQIDFEEFTRILKPTRNKKNDVQVTENIEEQSLYKFCRQAGYHYKTVSKAIALHSILKNQSLEQLINAILLGEKDQSKISPWVFEVYGSMIEQILLHLGLNPKKILKNISNNVILLEEAIFQEVFQSACKDNKCDYLDEIYKKILKRINFQTSEEENASQIVNLIYKIGKRNKLMQDEIDLLIGCFKNYIQIIREYQIIDVGFETNEEAKLEKIKKYNFTEEEIEESYFVPFYFEKGILLGEKSDLYKRRELLRQYIIDWDYYTEEEKESVKDEQHFTEEEFFIMKETRREINQAIEKIQKVKK